MRSKVATIRCTEHRRRAFRQAFASVSSLLHPFQMRLRYCDQLGRAQRADRRHTLTLGSGQCDRIACLLATARRDCLGAEALAGATLRTLSAVTLMRFAATGMRDTHGAERREHGPFCHHLPLLFHLYLRNLRGCALPNLCGKNAVTAATGTVSASIAQQAGSDGGEIVKLKRVLVISCNTTTAVGAAAGSSGLARIAYHHRHSNPAF